MINQAGVVSSDPVYSCSNIIKTPLTQTGKNMFFMDLGELMEYFDSIPDNDTEPDEKEPSRVELKKLESTIIN